MTRHSLQQPAIILIRPQMGENIGAAARAMWNFGLDHMRIVDPRDGWPSQKAVAMANMSGNSEKPSANNCTKDCPSKRI